MSPLRISAGRSCPGTSEIGGRLNRGNLNPERDYPSMFEPVHGSAPDIADHGIANPLGAIWSAAMMLDHLGHAAASAAILGAVESVLARGPVDASLTPDMGGTATTEELGRAIAGEILAVPA